MRGKYEQNNSLDHRVSIRIKEIINNHAPKKITQKELAKLSGMKGGYLSETLNFHPKRRWNLHNLEKICAALNISPITLFISQEEEKLILLTEEIMKISRGKNAQKP